MLKISFDFFTLHDMTFDHRDCRINSTWRYNL